MLINCAVYQHGVRLAEVGPDDIAGYLDRPDCFVWVALKDATPEELDHYQSVFHLHPLAVEDARHGHERPKVEEYGDSVFVVMHVLEAGRKKDKEGREAREPRNGAEHGPGHAAPAESREFRDSRPGGRKAARLARGEVDVFVGPRYILSIRNRCEHGFAEVRERCEQEPELLKAGPGFVLYALMDAVVDRYFPVAELLEDALEKIEQGIFVQGAARESIKGLYALKRRTTMFKHAVAPLLEGTGKLHGGRVPQICAGVQEYFRDVVDHLNRINNQVDSIRDTIGIAVQVNLSMTTIEEGEVAKRLTAWAAIFAVCTAYAGVWGMNFEHMPELKWEYGYPMALVLMFGTCGYLYYRFRKAGWL